MTKPGPTETKVPTGTKRPAGAGRSKGGRGGKKARKMEVKEEEEERTVTSGGQKPKNSKRRSIASKISYKEESDIEGGEEGDGLSDEEFQATSEGDSEDSDGEAKPVKGKKAKSKARANGNISAPKRRRSGGKNQGEEDEDGDGDKGQEDDEEGEEATSDKATKRRSGKRRGGPGADEWLEVYLDKTSTWVCVDVEHGVGLPHLCSQNATAPVTYVVSLDDDGFLKDLGRKYDPAWMTSSRKRRVEEEWWEQATEPFMGPEDEKDKREEKEVRQTGRAKHW